jgi:hypothetical protein
LYKEPSLEFFIHTRIGNFLSNAGEINYEDADENIQRTKAHEGNGLFGLLHLILAMGGIQQFLNE